MSVEWNDRKVISEVRSDAVKRLTKAALRVEGTAKRLQATPGFPQVQTGRFRASISHEIDAPNLTAKVGSDVEYAIHLEYKIFTHKGAIPTFRPALMMERDNIMKDFSE